jgi:hypothetical protein
VEDRPDGRYWTTDNSRPVAADTRHASEQRLETITPRDTIMRATGAALVGAIIAIAFDVAVLVVCVMLLMNDKTPNPTWAFAFLVCPWLVPPWMLVESYTSYDRSARTYHQNTNDYISMLYSAIDALPDDEPTAQPVRVVTPAPMTADDRQRDRLLAVAAYALRYGDAAVPKRGSGRNGRPDVTCANSGETLDEQAYMDTAGILVRLGIFTGGNGKPYALAAKWQGAAFDDIADVIEGAVV